MATTYPVLLVISLENAKSAKVQESVYAPVLISQDMYQVRTPFMARMEELSLPIVLGAGVGVHQVHPPHAQALHRQEVHVVGVVEQVSIPLQAQEEVCPHGWHIITAREINALIVVIILATCMINARHATCLDTKRKVL